jgi:hypothetical protein
MRCLKDAALLCMATSLTCGCVLRPGMNSDCAWPSEPVRALDLANAADSRHLVLDAELIDELVDRYRFHPVDEQRGCDQRLVAAVARTHAVSIGDVEQARRRVFDRGLNLPVILPVAALFIFSVLYSVRRIERRFGEELWPRAISLLVASVALSGGFLWVGEFWTSILQMIRVGSQHVGGRVNRLPWVQHQPQIFVLGIALFWTVYSLQHGCQRRSRLR